MVLCFILIHLTIKTIVSVSINRANALYTFLAYFTVMGIKKLLKIDKKYLILVIAIYLISSTSFIYYYFGIYGKNNTNFSFNNDIMELVGYLDKYENKNIDIIPYAVQPYIYVLLEKQVSPYEFVEKKNEGINIKYYDKYYFNVKEIKDDFVYAIKYPERRSKKFEEELYENGFKSEEYNGYMIFYK